MSVDKTNQHRVTFYIDLPFSLWASSLLSEITLQKNVTLQALFVVGSTFTGESGLDHMVPLLCSHFKPLQCPSTAARQVIPDLSGFQQASWLQGIVRVNVHSLPQLPTASAGTGQQEPKFVCG